MKKYEVLELEIAMLDTSDVITTSGPEGNTITGGIGAISEEE